MQEKPSILQKLVFRCLPQSEVNSTKLPTMALAWENLQEVFCDVGCCCCFTSLEDFHSLLFDVIPHPSVSYRRVFTPILYFQPSSSQSDSRHFHFNFLCFSFLPRVLRFWVGLFYPRFYTTLLRLWLRWGQEHLFQDPPLFLPTQSCRFRLTNGLELLMFELQDHWFINCASEPRSIELKLNYWICFACSKSYGKTIKTLWTRLDKKYCLKLLRQNCTSKLFWKSSHPESSQAS